MALDSDSQLSAQQQEAFDAALAWYETDPAKRPQIFRLFGYAGTGKTTTARKLASVAKGPVVYAAFTGKAALMMRKAGCANARTIHSLIYTPKQKKGGEVEYVLNDDSDCATASLVVIDEVSMVGEDLALDLLSFGTPVMVLGDPAQLPPVKGTGHFIDAKPDALLTEVHRQAKASSILNLATYVRNRGTIKGWIDPNPDSGEVQVFGRGVLTHEDLLSADMILCGRNATRQTFNNRLRDFKGFPLGKPVKGDQIVCLRNDRKKQIFNGGMFNIFDTPTIRKAPHWKFKVYSFDSDREPFQVTVREECFSGHLDALPFWKRKGAQEFDWGYVLTVHKAQGSQWDHVIVYDESGVFREDAGRWLYTAITRAANKLTIVC